MSKLYMIGGGILVLVVSTWFHVQQAKENARLEFSLEQAGETIAMMNADAKQKEQINLDLRQTREELENEKARLVADLEQLPRTETQRDCDTVAVPDGYRELLNTTPEDAVPNP